MALAPASFATDRLDPARAGAARELEAAITRAPAELDARRILADLLLEAGDSRGEFIRASCEVEELGPWDARRPALARLVASLEARGGMAWSRALRAVPGFDTADKAWQRPPFAFRRGFVELVRGNGSELLPRLDAAAGAAPICRVRLEQVRARDLLALSASAAGRALLELELDQAEPDWLTGEALTVAAGVLAPLTSFAVRGATTEPLAAALSGCRELVALRLEDTGRGEGIGLAGLERLLASGALARVRRLTLRGQKLGPEGARRLASLTSLEQLVIEDDALGPKGGAALAAAAELSSLRSLTLRGCELGDKGVRALVASKHLAGLERLDVAGNKLNGRKLPAVLDALALPALRQLGLADSNLKVDGARVLAATRALDRVEQLDLRGNTFKHEGAGILATAEGFPRLLDLDLSGNTIDAVGMRALAEGPFLSKVRKLAIGHNKCGTEGGKELAKWRGLPQLTELSLSYNWMGVLGVRALLERAERLLVLDADENNYGPEPIRAVAAGACPRLVVLRSREADAASLRALPSCAAAHTLEQLSIGGAAIDLETARAIASLPVLGRPRLSFCLPTPEAAAHLRERFGPFLETWGNALEWLP